MNVASFVTETVVPGLTRPSFLPSLFLQGQHHRFDFAVHHEHDAFAFHVGECERLTEKLGEVRLEFIKGLNGSDNAQSRSFKLLATPALMLSDATWRAGLGSGEELSQTCVSTSILSCASMGRGGMTFTRSVNLESPT